MGFGEDLWCPQAHAAVVKLLDSELHLMEVMKKWMGQRAKSERDFSAQLHHMSTMVEKMERSQHGAGPDYISQLNKVRGSQPPGRSQIILYSHFRFYFIFYYGSSSFIMLLSQWSVSLRLDG